MPTLSSVRLVTALMKLKWLANVRLLVCDSCTVSLALASVDEPRVELLQASIDHTYPSQD
jgi:hypothetical protein